MEIIEAMIEGKLPPASMAETIPMQIKEAESGRVLFEVMANHRHLNPMGGVHGGFAATVLDSVTGCAVHTMLEAGVGYGTIDLNVKMLKAVPTDTRLIAEGKLINLSHSIGVSEGTLRNEEGKIFAYATATCMILRK